MVVVRAASPEDEAVPELLYLASAPYYDVYAGSRDAALSLLRRVYRAGGHTASWEQVAVAELDGVVVGALAGFPLRRGEQLAGRFVWMTVPRMPPWRWPSTFRHLHAAGKLTPRHPPASWYVDSLAVAPEARRQGVGFALLAEAERRAQRANSRGVALDTGLHNRVAQQLYEAYGFERGETRHAPDERTARAIGETGFVSYFKPRP